MELEPEVEALCQVLAEIIVRVASQKDGGNWSLDAQKREFQEFCGVKG